MKKKDVTALKRVLAFLLCLGMICIPVKAGPSEKLVALTFDDGPSGRFTQKLLDGLQQRNAQATFFLCGYRMTQYPELTARIFREGHEIGFHGYTHKPMKNMCVLQVREELEKAKALLPEDCEVSFLRTPGGMTGPCARNAAKQMGLSLLSWSVDPKDWATNNKAAIEKEVIDHVRDGDVILLHDMSHSSVDAALEIVDALQKQGYRFVTVSELAAARNISLQPGKEYTRF